MASPPGLRPPPALRPPPGLRRRGVLAALVAATAAVVAAACGGPDPAVAPRPAATPPARRAAEGVPLPRAHIVLDTPAPASLVAERAGVRLHLEGRARIALHDDGRVERGRALLPRGQARAVELPARLGGGWVFAVVGGSGSQIFRADTWTGELQPLASTASVIDSEEPVVAGFDRLYVRIKSQNLLAPIDVRTGATMPLGSLPLAGAYGTMIFADGWRAIVETDLRGLVATFDAGATWRPLPAVEGAPRLGLVDGDPAVITASAVWVLRGDGRFSPQPPEPEVEPARAAPPPTSSALPLGPSPLRAALEDGWPDAEGTAVVARHGTLARVSLVDGATTFVDDDAFPEPEARCHALPLGRGIGFACGEPDRGTTVYQLVRGAAAGDAIAMREILRFATPRRVTSSGNGAIVVGGPCSDAPDDGTDGQLHCARAPSGATRELRLRGASAGARLVALADGRVVILVPPAADRQGQLTILTEDRATHVPLRFVDTEDEGPARRPPAGDDEGAEADLRAGLDPVVRGTWLDGLQEIEPGVLGGWIEAGGPVAGYRVTLDGRVELGEVVEEDAALVAGPYGLAFDAGGRAVETTDFGRTWTERDLVPLDLDTRDAPRVCGPAGCALPGALRVGWGEPASPDDLAVVDEPTPLPVAIDRLAQKPLALACRVVSGPHGGASPARAERPAAPAAPRPRPRRAADRAAPAIPAEGEVATLEPATPNGWQPLRGVAAPALDDGEIGFDAGQPFEQVAFRAYAWGTRAGWGRTSRWLARFDDRFDARGIRSTRPTSTPWAQETSAGEAFGVGSYAYATTWAAAIDPGGRHAVVSGCTGRPCALYLAEDGGALLPLRDPAGLGFARPSGPVAQLGRTTWFLGLAAQPGPGGDAMFLHRAEGGVVTRVAPLRRPQPPRWAAPQPVRLARRARSEAVGLVSTAFAGPNDRRGRLIVVPVDASGTLGEAIDLGRADLADRAARPCVAGDDGWLIDVSWDRPPAIVDLGGGAPRGGRSAGPTAQPRISGLDARVRVDPGSLCVESFAAGVDGPLAGGSARGAAGGDGRGGIDVAPGAVPLAVTSRGSGERWGLACTARP